MSHSLVKLVYTGALAVWFTSKTVKNILDGFLKFMYENIIRAVNYESSKWYNASTLE